MERVRERNRRKKEGGRAEDRIREEARVWLDTVCYFKSSDCCRSSNSNRCLIFSYFVSLLFSRSSLTTASTLLNHHNNKNQPGSHVENHTAEHTACDVLICRQNSATIHEEYPWGRRRIIIIRKEIRI